MEAPTLAHVAFAVSDIEKTAKVLELILARPFSTPQQVHDQGVSVAFADLGGVGLELLEAATERSPSMPLLPNPIRSFLAKHGAGLHHICLQVESLDTVLKRLSAAGIGALPGGISCGADGRRVAFLNPNDTAELLIELVEGKV